MHGVKPHMEQTDPRPLLIQLSCSHRVHELLSCTSARAFRVYLQYLHPVRPDATASGLRVSLSSKTKSWLPKELPSRLLSSETHEAFVHFTCSNGTRKAPRNIGCGSQKKQSPEVAIMTTSKSFLQKEIVRSVNPLAQGLLTYTETYLFSLSH